jgi:hypothetical protein
MTSGREPLRIETLDFLDLATGVEAIVDRPNDARTWEIPPAVLLKGDSLVFEYSYKRMRGEPYLTRSKSQAHGGVLTRFMELADASDEKILAYAIQYGRLGLCKHGELQHLATDWPDCMQSGLGGKFVEPLRRWREHAKRARALLNAIAQFSKRGVVSDVTLIALNENLGRSAAALEEIRREGWSSIGLQVQIWLRAFRVRPELLYDRGGKRFHIRLRGRPGLGSALAMQFMILVGQSKGFAICASCARPFPPKRQVSPSRESYCGKCGIRAAWRDAQRRRRKKIRGV